MLETVKGIVKEIEELEKELMGMLSLSDLADANDDTIKMFKSYANLMKLSKNLMVEQAELLEGIDKKLDKLLEK